MFFQSNPLDRSNVCLRPLGRGHPFRSQKWTQVDRDLCVGFQRIQNALASLQISPPPTQRVWNEHFSSSLPAPLPPAQGEALYLVISDVAFHMMQASWRSWQRHAKQGPWWCSGLRMLWGTHGRTLWQSGWYLEWGIWGGRPGLTSRLSSLGSSVRHVSSLPLSPQHLVSASLCSLKTASEPWWGVGAQWIVSSASQLPLEPAFFTPRSFHEASFALGHRLMVFFVLFTVHITSADDLMFPISLRETSSPLHCFYAAQPPPLVLSPVSPPTPWHPTPPWGAGPLPPRACWPFHLDALPSHQINHLCNLTEFPTLSTELIFHSSFCVSSGSFFHPS